MFRWPRALSSGCLSSTCIAARCVCGECPALDGDFGVEALDEALSTYGVPELFDTDQACQFTCEAFTGVLKQATFSTIVSR